MVQNLLTRIDRAREELTVALTIAERYRSVTSTSKKEVHITLESNIPRNVGFVLGYRIRRAGWYPIYTTRVMSDRNSGNESKVRLLAYALVRNRTGEDWRNVKLNFSAADPSESATLPGLYEWRITARLRPAGRTAGIFKGGSMKKSKRGIRRRYERRKYIKKDYSRRPKSVPRKHYSKRKPAVQSADESVSIAQSRVNQQRRRSMSFYSNNKMVIKEKRARQRSYAIEKNLRDFRRNMKYQNRAFNSGRYRVSLNRSRRVLDNIEKLDPKYRRLFDREKKRAKAVQKISLKLLEQHRLIRRLVSPRKSSRGYDYRYKAAISETIKSDGAFHKVLIVDKMLNAKMAFESAPIRKKLAYLIGKVRYRGDTPLLAGPVAVFHNTDFVGEAMLGNVSSKERFKLNLGNDKAIQLHRKRTQFRKKAGLFKKSYIFNKKIQLTVKNRKKYAINIFLFDRIPVPGDDRVKISNIEINVRPDKQDKSGLLRFRLRLAPGEKKEIVIKYKMTHPVNVLPVYREISSPRW